MLTLPRAIVGILLGFGVLAGWSYLTRDDSYSRLPLALKDVPGQTYGPDQRRGFVADCAHHLFGDRCGAWRPDDQEVRHDR